MVDLAKLPDQAIFDEFFRRYKCSLYPDRRVVLFGKQLLLLPQRIQPMYFRSSWQWQGNPSSKALQRILHLPSLNW